MACTIGTSANEVTKKLGTCVGGFKMHDLFAFDED